LRFLDAHNKEENNPIINQCNEDILMLTANRKTTQQSTCAAEISRYSQQTGRKHNNQLV